MRDSDGSVSHGEVTFRKEPYDGEGARLFRYYNWLLTFVGDHDVRFLSFEDVKFQSSQLQTRLWSGWLTCTLLVAEMHHIQAQGFATNIVKMHASGVGNAGKRRMQVAAKSIFNLNYLPRENEADALCVLHTCELWSQGEITLPKRKKKRNKRTKKPDAQSEFLAIK